MEYRSAIGSEADARRWTRFFDDWYVKTLNPNDCPGWKAGRPLNTCEHIKRGAFAPDRFAVGLAVVGGLLLLIPLLRFAGALVLSLGIAYWLLMIALKLMRR